MIYLEETQPSSLHTLLRPSPLAQKSAEAPPPAIPRDKMRGFFCAVALLLFLGVCVRSINDELCSRNRVLRFRFPSPAHTPGADWGADAG